MVITSYFSLEAEDQRIRNLIGARKRYSEFSKDQSKNGSREASKLKAKIHDNRKEISKIKSELEQCRTEFNRIVKTIGRAHAEAILREDEEDIVDELIKQRDKRVKSRAELVLLEEIHRLKLLDLKKQLEKEKLLKRRREIFSMRSPKPKVKVNKEYQEKLNEWKLLENVLQNEINQLKKDKELSRTKSLEPSTDKDMKQVKFRTKVTKVNTHAKKKVAKNVEVQTEANHVESATQSETRSDQPLEETYKLSKPKLNQPASSPNVPTPFKQVNMRLENLLTLRVAEKISKLMTEEPTEMVKNTKDIGINTSKVEPVHDMSETLYLPLPSDKRSESKQKTHKETIKESVDRDINKSSTDVSSSLVDLNLEELVTKIQHIKHLVNYKHKELSTKVNNISFGDKKLLNSNNLTYVCGKVTHDQSVIDEQELEPKDHETVSLVLTDASSSTPLSLSQQSLPSLSSSKCSTPNSSNRTFTQHNPQITKHQLSISSDDLSLSMEEGRCNDSLSSVSRNQSISNSFDFSSFTNLLTTDKYWSSLIDLTGIKRSNTSTKTHQRPFRYIQSTPKAKNYRESII
ncbi:putative leucine-rich repeat-containing protein DDB_G0290503 [Tetranychus urticae]|uniref:Uncharacterized protein n=1 Tax=Tetranychus urticae TaxID=32264 RepID=T1KL00_TETUR|nr:putative leucine-rich repeat-containing protein DDB_G0290503 [Tetranychus urticae]